MPLRVIKIAVDQAAYHFDKLYSYTVPESLGPVSYTHLDVYKRQDYCGSPRQVRSGIGDGERNHHKRISMTKPPAA